MLLAASLVHYTWDQLTETGPEGRPAWFAQFASHETLAVGLVIFVAAALVLPLAELLAPSPAKAAGAIAARRPVFTRARSSGEDSSP